MRYFSSFLVLIALLGSFSVLSFAQTTDQSADLAIRSTPSDPKPGATVVLEAVSFDIDVNQATLTWVYDGKQIAAGFGKRQISVVAPRSGATSIATVTVSVPGSNPVSTSIAIRPGGVDLLWEGADATVPPFYKGRPLLAPSGLARIVAIPAANAPRQANFQWSKNDSALANASGAGKTSIILEHSALDTHQNIAVQVSGGAFSGSGAVDIPLEPPDVIAYPVEEGFVNYAKGERATVSIKGSGGIVRFEPLFFSASRGIDQDLRFLTTVNDEVVYGNPVNELRFSRPEEGGTHRITLGITTAHYSLQNLTRAFSLLFQ